MAFALYIMRETFNDWTVDFFKTEGGPAMSSQIAAMLSTPFDAAGALGIVLLGWGFDRLSHGRRTMALAVTLVLLAVLIYCLPGSIAWAFGRRTDDRVDRLLVLWSLQPAGRRAGGRNWRKTWCGNGSGRGGFSRVCWHRFRRALVGKLLDWGGYNLGFHVLALVTITLLSFAWDSITGNRSSTLLRA